MEGGSQHDIDEFDTHSNTETGNNIALDEDEDADEDDHDLLMDILAFQAKARAHAVLDVAPITGPSTVLGTLNAFDEHLHHHIFDPEPHPEEEDQDWQPYETFQKTWPLDYESYLGGNWDADNSRGYSAAAVYQLTSSRPLPDSFTVEFSARNILDIHSNGLCDFQVGAEATVEIPIKNAKPEVQSDMEMDKKNYETEDYPGYNKIYPVFHDLMVTNPTTCEEVPYEVKIDWRPGWDYGWETLTYDWISHGEWMEKEVSIPTPDDANGDTVDIRYTIKTYDQYGGWELDTEYKRDSFTVTNNDGDPPPGGPPRPPPGGPHPVSESSDDILDYSKQSYQVDDLWGYDWDTTSLELIDTDQVESILEDEEVWLLEEDGVLYLVDERGEGVMFYIHS